MRGLKMKKRAFAAILTTVVACSLTTGVMTGYGASYYDYDYDWDSGVFYDDYTVKGDDDMPRGPAAIPDVDSVVESGPSVSQTTIVEQYHADYKIYEESIAGIFFFYSNVANGGITHEPVVLDLPMNLTWTVEKDGAPWNYASRQIITEYGTYVFRFLGIEDKNVPLSEQKEYRAVYRFRIQAKPPEETTAAAETSEPSTGVSGGYDSSPISGGVYLGPNGLQTETNAETSGAGDVGLIVGTETDETDDETPEETEAIPAVAGPEETSAERTEHTETESEASLEENAESETKPIESTDKAGFIQNYDTTENKYKVTFENDIVMVSNVPSGYIGAGPVQITLPEKEWDAVSIYKDDELLETVAEENSRNFAENGYYRVEAGGNSWSFALLTASNRMDVYPAPVGMTFKEASLDGQPLVLNSKNYVLMEEEGQYALTMEGTEGNTLVVGIKKDTEAPEMTITVGQGVASIQYLSDDVTVIRLEKSGELVENFNGYSVTTPGNYRLTIADEAGNTVSETFNLAYQVNAYGIAAVILIILVIIGIVIFVIHTKRDVKIR